MKLKSLEISGFKSFANKTIFHFPSKITSIVGPNGSGKSNVADAIKWVLGERDLKGLRISKNEDIIFGGTPSKAKMSLAQVNLILDNSKKELPVDFNEIVITRKLSRDGESEYLINKANVRLKDIIELLAKAKIGYQGISIINQGSADAILKASPKERRMMIEENLGLKEFQIKKEEAKRRLSHTEDNLVKTKNLIDEIFPHLKSLRRQVNRWNKKEEIENNLRELERIFFGFHFKKIFSDKENILKNKREIEIEFNKEKEILNNLEKRFEELNQKKPDFSNQFQELQNKIKDIEDKKGKILREIGNIEGQIQGLKRIVKKPTSHFQISIKELENILNEVKNILEDSLKLNNLEGSRNNFKLLLERIKNVLKEDKEEKEEEELNDKISAEEKELLSQKDELSEKLIQLEKEIDNLNLKHKELREKDEQSGSDSRKILLEVEKKRREIDILRQKINQFSLEEERINIRENDLKDKIKGSEINLGNFSEKEIKEMDFEEEIKRIGGNFNELENKIFRFRRELSSIGEIDELTIKEAKETEERYNFLSKELDDLLKAKENLENMENELANKINDIFSSSLKEINKEFNEYFRIMFGGGSAKLSLISLKKKNEMNENDEEIENDNSKQKKENELGIEFNLEIPKKKISGLESLSGGERTLVSISILFAIVSAMKPPFVILDEIDAALDESNSKRFSKILDELDDHTQFVIITHNRRTMECSQSLYGITMPEQGVSKSVSLKLEEV